MVAFRHMLNIGIFIITDEMIWIHGLDTLLPIWDCSVHDTLECNAIPDRKERQVLWVFEEKCCWKKELKKTSPYGTLSSTTELLLRRIRLHILQRRGGMRLVWNA